MNWKIFPAIIFAVISPAIADDAWLTNVAKGLEQAAKEKKTVLVEFTGSDWCGPCMMLKANVFESDEFKQFAEKNLVLVELDSPRKKEMPAEQKEYNEKMAAEYGRKGFPTVCLLDEKGTMFWKRVGGGRKNSYLSDLTNALDQKEFIISHLEKAKTANGLEKASFLASAYKKMSNDLKAHYSGLMDEIIALDKDDSLGFTKYKAQLVLDAEQEADMNKFFRGHVSPLTMSKKYDEAIAKIEEYLQKPGLTVNTRQNLLMYQGMNSMRKPDMDKALEYFEKVHQLSPESRPGKNSRETINHIKADRKILEDQMKAYNNQ